MTDQEYAIRTVLYWVLSIYFWIGVFWGVGMVKQMYDPKDEDWGTISNLFALATIFLWPVMMADYKKFEKKYKEEHKDGGKAD